VPNSLRPATSDPCQDISHSGDLDGAIDCRGRRAVGVRALPWPAWSGTYASHVV